jgi:hypothetical protein
VVLVAEIADAVVFVHERQLERQRVEHRGQDCGSSPAERSFTSLASTIRCASA